MNANSGSTVADLIEQHRNTGMFGTEPWLKELPDATGTCVSALHYLEGYADRLVGAWESHSLSEPHLRELIQSTCSSYIAETVAVIDSTLESAQNDPNLQDFGITWKTLRQFITKLSNAAGDADIGPATFSLLIAIMIIQQDFVSRVRGAPSHFDVSTGLRPSQYLDTIAIQSRLRPFNFHAGAPLSSLRRTVINELSTLL